MRTAEIVRVEDSAVEPEPEPAPYVPSTSAGSVNKTTGADGKINADAASDEVFFTGSFQELFTNHMVGSLANDIRVTKTMLSNYETVAEELYVDRDAVQGVDLNDEAMNMMQFQKAYSAACRLMTTFDDMLDRLINGTAM